MRVLVVLESMFGNTERIGWAVAHALRPVADVDVVGASVAPALPGSDVRLVIVGAPTHGFSLPTAQSRKEAVHQGASPDRAVRGVREWLDALDASASFDLAAFTTRVERAPRFPRGAAAAAARIARHRGIRVVGTEAFLVKGTQGPVVDGEVERAARWAATLLPVPAGRTPEDVGPLPRS
ncbi:flavodoxin [Amnibacterium kyonggiense]|uniref:Flavodoxin-like domain-containing protein n=1 Tax=Amnibacterium kyonggiense TaxID=595671 RepID=A0A4R7FKF5_9MICO|nr:flavodoxin [Amnibacterium kyonggiense]TDS76851.1 hypothetical protein CLV52_1789 [Amnibacterium kyonggiense]